MGKLIDADKLREELEYHTFAENSTGEFIRDRILKIVDDQPEVKAPFKAITEVKIDEDKLRSICKEQLEKMMKQRPISLQPDPKIETNGWIRADEKQPELHAQRVNGEGTLFYRVSDEVVGWSEGEGYVFAYYSAELQGREKWDYGWFYSDREYGREDEPCDDILAWLPLTPYRENQNEN